MEITLRSESTFGYVNNFFVNFSVICCLLSNGGGDTFLAILIHSFGPLWPMFVEFSGSWVL